MIIVENNNEKLLETLYLVKLTAASSTCIYIPFASGASSSRLEELIECINHVINDKDGQIFICGDRDIFVLANGITLKAFAVFKSNLSQSMGENFANVMEMTARYTVDFHWDEPIEKVKKKISDAQEIKKRKQEDFEQQRKESRLREINSLMRAANAAALRQRRMERSHVEVEFAEDDLFQRKLISMALDPDFFVTSAGDGLSCLSQYIIGAPDILFLDIGLPDISGQDLLKKILEIDPEAYVVMLSGNGNRENVLKALNAGAKGFIAKPFTKEKLFHYINKCSAKTLVRKTEVR